MSLLPRPLSSSIDAVARSALGKDWSLYANLFKHWPEIVGQEYAQTVTPVKISFPKGKKDSQQWASPHQTGGTLVLRIPQGLVMEFSFLTDQIQQRINHFFGYEAIQKIQFAPYYPEKKAKESRKATTPLSQDEQTFLQSQINDIKNNKLRDVLEQLGESILRQNRS